MQYTSHKYRQILFLPGLNVGNVQGITQALHMGPEYEVIRTKQGLDAIAHLVTNLEINFIVLFVDNQVECKPCLLFGMSLLLAHIGCRR